MHQIRFALPEGKGWYLKELSRDQLELLAKDLVERTLAPCSLAMKDAGLTASAIDEVGAGGWIHPHAAGPAARPGLVRQGAALRAEP